MTKYYEARLKKLQALLKKLDLDGMIVYQGFNTKYLTGFDGGTGDISNYQFPFHHPFRF